MTRLAVVLFALAASSACLRSTTTIVVRADGSGTVLQETGMNAQALAMLQSMAGAAAEKAGGAGGAPQIFGEQQARKAAADMGVRFAGGEPIKTADMEGYRARFEFDDIRTVKMKMNQDPTIGEPAQAPREPPFEFGFERRGASSILTITMPEQQPGQGPLGGVAGVPGMPSGSGDAQGNQQALAMMKAMMQGLFVDISLDVDGPIVKTNAAHVNGSRITLLQVDFDTLLKDPTAWQKLQSAGDVKALANVPGLKVVTDRVLTVQFGG